MAKNKKRFTIGVLVGGIMDDITRYVCRGVMQEARTADVNVVVFPGKYWERDLSDNRELMYEYQYSTVFSYARKENVDALIISAGSIGCFTSKKGMEDMLKQFKDIPCVLIASKIEGYTDVGFDNYLGIREGMEYLIKNCGCRRFGMVGGSLENSDACERKQTFIKVLSEHGIPFTEKMYVQGDFTKRSETVCRKLLDENPDLEAIFCVNDDTALGLYEELKRRGLQAGKDISVFGYDDTLAATKTTPTLASVRADSTKLGEESLKMAVCMAKGEKVESRVIPTRFVKRDSVAEGKTEENGIIYNIKEWNNSFEEIFYRYCHDVMEERMAKLKVSYRNLMDTITRRFTGEYCGEDKAVMLCVEEFLKLGGVEYADVDNLLFTLEQLYKSLRNVQPGDFEKFELRNVFSSIYRKIIRAMDGQLGRIDASKEAENYSIKLFVQEMLQFEKGRDQSYGTLLERLDWLNIKNAGIYILQKPIFHLFMEGFDTPKELYMKAALQNNQVETIPVSKQKRTIADIFSDIYKEERFECVLLPLFFKESIYGILCCDMTEEIHTNGEFLINQVSSAIKMISLLRANEKIQQQLEENLAALKEHNIELDTISKSDVMTGILNRRGFYGEAEERVKKSRENGKMIMAVYVDMNNLKIINDRYGHKEGDHSLILIGQFLKELVGNNGVAGRIGGDEFACIMEYDEKNTDSETEAENTFLSTLYHKFETYNETSDKPYNVTVSAGACFLRSKDGITLKEALMQADEKLYEVKKLRKKDVAK